MQLTMLGSVQVHWDEGAPPRFRSQRTVALLGYLVAEQRPISRDHLAALFWPDEEPAKGKANLRRELHNLARILPDCWQTSRVEVGFVPDEDVTVDIFQFLEFEAQARWQAASDLISGDFLEGISLAENLEFETWLLGQQEQWRQRCTAVLHQLLTRKTERGQYQRAIKDGRHLLQLAPWHEETHRQVMLLLAWTGERTTAIRQFESCRQLLAEHLAVAPEEDTLNLYEHILAANDEADLKQYLANSYPQLKPPHNLPQPVTSFIGRSEALIKIQNLLSQPEVRLLTLTGPGGTGKTRLALEVAHLILNTFQHGLFFIDLAPLTDPNQIAAKIAEELQIFLNANPSILDQLKAYLCDKQLLLLLDNIEHLLAAAPQISSLLAAAPNLKVLVTSRVLLRLSGEWDFPVHPLTLPDLGERPFPQTLSNYDAIRLFQERAKALKPDFALTPESETAVAEICIRLDGLPLAIELVAARSRLLSPTQILAQWDNGLSLTSQGARDLPDRQQTLKATLDWSYNLLQAEEQTLFARLAVFVGGFTLDAAEGVCSLPDSPPILVGLESLLDNNMIRESVTQDEPRFRMLVTVQEYALNLLSSSKEENDIRQRHAIYFMHLAEAAQPYFHGGQEVSWVNKLEKEQDNLRAALAWSSENDLEVNLCVASALGRYWHRKGHHQEGRKWLEQALEKEKMSKTHYPQLKAKALNEAGVLAQYQGDSDTAANYQTESVNLWRQLNDNRGLAYALCDLGAALRHQEDLFSRVRSLMEESVLYFKQLGDRQGLSYVYFWSSHTPYLQKDYATAKSIAEMCIQLNQESANNSSLVGPYSVLGRIAFQQQQFAEAEEYFQKCLNLSLQVIDVYSMGLAPKYLGLLAYVQADYERALAFFEESEGIWRKINNNRRRAKDLFLLAMAARHLNDYERARTTLYQSYVLCEQLQDDKEIVMCLFGLAVVALSEGKAEQAAQLLGTAEVNLGNGDQKLEDVFARKYLFEFEPVTAVFRDEYKQTAATLQDLLTPEKIAELWAQGRKQSTAQVFLPYSEKSP